MKQSQHYISQKHLSYWSTENQKVYRCDLNTGEIKHLPILSVAKKNNEWAQEVENPIFSNFEGKYPKVIEWLEARKEITSEIEFFLKSLQSILHARAPKQKENMNRITNELQHKPTIKHYTQAMIAGMMVHHSFSKGIKAYIGILIAPKDRSFVITDNPAVLCLPLTPTICLLTPSTEKGGNGGKYVNVDKDFVKIINNENIKRADKYVFSFEAKHPDIMDYLAENKIND